MNVNLGDEPNPSRNQSSASSARQTMLRRVYCFLAAVGREFHTDRCPQIAAALSYTSVLSIVPILTVIFTTLALVPAFRGWQTAIEQFIFANFVPASGDQLQSYIAAFVSKAAALQTLGFILLALSVFSMMATIEQTFNEIWHVSKRRALIKRGVLYFAILSLAPCALMFGLVATSYLVSLPLLQATLHMHAMVPPLLRVLPLAASMLAFLASYKFIPNRPVRWAHAAIGSAVAALIFEAAKRLFAVYLLHFPSQQVIYGAFAVIPIFLLWIYLCWLIVLFGAELTYGLTVFWTAREHG